jgi:shikimate dehydrogenase
MNKRFLVIGNPIEHSLSPKLHNYWIKKNNLNASYDKKFLVQDEIQQVILDVREDKIQGLNVTVPFKKTIIPFLDILSDEAKNSQSVNTIYKNKDKIIGDNTDIDGFKIGLETTNQVIKDKEALILGAGGVVPSIIIALKKMQISKIYLSNRTESKALDIKKFFSEIEIIEWGKVSNFDIIINATSIGLDNKEEINIDYKNISQNKFFYDVIYNPTETNFLKRAREFGAHTENGKMMFVYQAQKAFFTWHNILPLVDDETLNLLNT